MKFIAKVIVLFFLVTMANAVFADGPTPAAVGSGVTTGDQTGKPTNCPINFNGAGGAKGGQGTVLGPDGKPVANPGV